MNKSPLIIYVIKGPTSALIFQSGLAQVSDLRVTFNEFSHCFNERIIFVLIQINLQD